MSTVPPDTKTLTPPTQVRQTDEIKLISHSTLFYWWPVWVLAFFMAIWTYIENHRLVIVPAHGSVQRVIEVGKEGAVRRIVDVEKNSENYKGEYLMTFQRDGQPRATRSLSAAVENEARSEPPFPVRVTQAAWPGAVFVVALVLTIVITNVPLRGLWSFVTIILVVLLALFVSLLEMWDRIFDALGSLQIYINMAGYMVIGVVVFLIWALATFVFDRRSYVIFTPGQVRVCEHIGDSVQTYSTFGVGLEKQRDDLFRHYILGFGSGDLILKTAGDKREIRLPNVLGIGWRLKNVEDMLRRMATTSNG